VVNSGDFGVHNPNYTRYIMQVASDNLTNLGLPQIARQQVASIPTQTKLTQINVQRTLARKADETSG